MPLAMIEHVADVAVAFVVTLGVIVSAVCSYLAARHSKRGSHHAERGADYSEKVNRAVNDRGPHSTSTLSDNVLDLVRIVGGVEAKVSRLDEWREGYTNEGGRLDTGKKVQEFVKRMDDHVEKVNQHIETNNKQHDQLRNSLHSLAKACGKKCDDCPGGQGE